MLLLTSMLAVAISDLFQLWVSFKLARIMHTCILYVNYIKLLQRSALDKYFQFLIKYHLRVDVHWWINVNNRLTLSSYAQENATRAFRTKWYDFSVINGIECAIVNTKTSTESRHLFLDE